MLSRLFAILIAALAALPASSSFAADPLDAYGREWSDVLKPLRTMPVQDYGFVRSGVSFAESRLLTITEKRSFEGRDPLSVIILLMASEEASHEARVIRIMHPDLVRLYGDKYISLHDVEDREKQMALAELMQAKPEALIKPIEDLQKKAQVLGQLEHEFAILPREHEWLPPADAHHAEEALTATDRAIIEAWSALKTAIQQKNPEQAKTAAATLAERVTAASQVTMAEALPPLKLDSIYHASKPFATAALFYLLAALAYGAGLVLNRRLPMRIGFALLAIGLLAHATGVGMRWVLAGRAPLSNMYESFVFAVGGMILVALIIEAIHKVPLAGLGAAILGFIFMVLADKAPIFYSQIRPLMPALQSSWLTYHVATIMLSYSAFALSFFISLTYLAKDWLGGDQARGRLLRALPTLESLDVLNYRMIAVGFPLLTLGIILGAVWAATAWGRPWGFDPKETWSAITWLVYAIYLHVRYLGNWKGRRAAILALVGFACVLFTYVGVNYLHQGGLHSYVS